MLPPIFKLNVSDAVKWKSLYDRGTKVGPTSGTHRVLLQAQHDDPLKLKSDENSWIFHLYLVKGPKKTTLMRCGFIVTVFL